MLTRALPPPGRWGREPHDVLSVFAGLPKKGYVEGSPLHQVSIIPLLLISQQE